LGQADDRSGPQSTWHANEEAYFWRQQLRLPVVLFSEACFEHYYYASQQHCRISSIDDDERACLDSYHQLCHDNNSNADDNDSGNSLPYLLGHDNHYTLHGLSTQHIDPCHAIQQRHRDSTTHIGRSGRQWQQQYHHYNNAPSKHLHLIHCAGQ
jgi:hypothetical protein